MKYKRILLKLTGEAFGDKGIDFPKVEKIANYLIELKKKTQTEMVVVLGAGNIFRGRYVAGTNFDRVTADYMGMTATFINSLALHGKIEEIEEGESKIMSSYEMGKNVEVFSVKKGINYLKQGKILILAGGTGNPFFTTDSGAALRACELKCEVILKACNVDGVYDSDPKINPEAKLYENLTYERALIENLQVMDSTAFALCQNEKIPIVVFNIDELENIEKIVSGKNIGTLVN